MQAISFPGNKESNKSKYHKKSKARGKVTLMPYSSHVAMLVVRHFNESKLKAMRTGRVPKEDVFCHLAIVPPLSHVTFVFNILFIYFHINVLQCVLSNYRKPQNTHKSALKSELENVTLFCLQSPDKVMNQFCTIAYILQIIGTKMWLGQETAILTIILRSNFPSAHTNLFLSDFNKL